MTCALLEGPSDAAEAWLQGEAGDLGTDLPRHRVERGGSEQEPASFPSTKARMGPGAMDHEGSERHSQDMVQCKALGQAVPEVEHLALACSVMS